MGADPEALEGLAARLRSTGRHLDAVAARLTATLRSGPWEGPDARRFRDRWAAYHRPALHRLSDGCTAAARALVRHASEQRRASAATGGPGTVSAGAAATPRGRTGGRVPLPPPLPAAVDVYAVGLDVTVTPVAAAAGTAVTVEDLGGGRLRVSHTERAGVGAGLGAGRSAAVERGGRAAFGASGGAAAGSLRAGTTTTRSWTVHRGDLDDLLAGIAVDASPLGGPSRLARRFSGGLDAAASALGLDLPLERLRPPGVLPEPDRSEQLVAVTLAGTAAVSAGRDGAGVASSSTMAVGTSHGHGGGHLVAEWSEHTTGTLTLGLARALGVETTLPVGSELTVRAELPTGAAGPAPGLVTLTATSADQQVVVRAALGTGAAAALRDGLREVLWVGVRDGPTGAATVLSGLDLATEVRVRVQTRTVEVAQMSAPLSFGPLRTAPSMTHVRVRAEG
jgi:hypothetical protein